MENTTANGREEKTRMYVRLCITERIQEGFRMRCNFNFKIDTAEIIMTNNVYSTMSDGTP